MPRQLDERFLSVHPATALWWEQRKQCARCIHMVEDKDGKGGSYVMRCRGVPFEPNGHNSKIAMNCVDARNTGWCGPEGAMFREKK